MYISMYEGFEPWETTGKPNQFAKVKAYLLPVPGLHYSIYLYGKISIQSSKMANQRIVLMTIISAFVVC